MSQQVHELIAEMQKSGRLMEHCAAFIKTQRIECTEDVYQSDHVIVNAYEFIAGICEIVGYAKPEEEDEG
ncbi:MULTISPECIES: hypothetical protein [unclassified Bradyrhizobium]|uniref:hypothetical protein n=1 Tax=unclassified Bradyrhizobium TaxID=2631580 RepID=UPI00291705D3|nr:MULTISPECIES: hypothetical protein [unclassified Bradyrhizobium]